MNGYLHYSEEQYVSKQQLQNMYSASISACIWDEIIFYRKQYKYPLRFQAKEFYLTMNAYVFHKMLKIYEVDFEKSIYFTSSIRDELIHYMKTNKLEVNHILFDFLLSEEVLLIRIFVIWWLKLDEQLILFYLQCYKKEYLYTIIKNVQRLQMDHHDENDLTYELRHFLDEMYLHLRDKMIYLLNSSVCLTQTKEELSLRYPQVNKKAIHFFVQHRGLNHFYTIEHYMQFTNVCYENARQSMEKMVALDWYQKHKIGKKFVYVIR